MVNVRVAVAAMLLTSVSLTAAAQIAAPPGAKVYFIEPADGATVKSPVKVKFGLVGMGVAPALVDWPNTGHHHLMIDRDAVPPGSAIPNDATSVHFGGGQTEADVVLAPGKHTLMLQIGDHQHVPHLPSIESPKITITVVP
jgi:hypothetical protein